MQELTAGRYFARAAAPRDAPVIEIAGQAVTLEFHHKLDGLAPLWDEIALSGAEASVFQSYDWLVTWARTAAAASNERPLIVVARATGGELKLVLPLGIETVAGLPVAGFLGQSHASYGLALIEPDFAARMNSAGIRALFNAVARRVPIAAVRLDHQPATWNGRPNPFAVGNTWVSANDSYVLALDGRFSDLYAGLFSARTRQTLRRKWKRLGDLGGLRTRHASNAADRTRLLETFLAAKSQQLREGGIGDLFSDPGIVAFYRELAEVKIGGTYVLDICSIEAGGEIGAIVLLVSHRGRRYLLNTALCSPRLRDGSPGLQLLTRDIEHADTTGLESYDFGPGAAAYKSAWNPQSVPLLTRVFPITAAGAPLVAHMTATVVVKRTIKRNPAIWQFARNLRRNLFGAPKDAPQSKSNAGAGPRDCDGGDA